MKNYRKQDCFDKGSDIHITKLCHAPGNIGAHTHEFAELVYVSSGTGAQVVDGVSYPVRRGTVIFINYGSVHNIVPETPMTQMNVLISPGFISRELAGCDNFLDILALSQFAELREFTGAEIPYTVFEGEELLFFESLFRRMLDEFNGKKLGYEAEIRGCLSVIFSELVRRLTGGNRPPCRIPSGILDYIDANLGEKLTAEKIAERCFYNPNYLSEVFRKTYGMTLKDYIRGRRVSEAARLLRLTDLSIDEIMYRVGFTNRTDFWKHFEKVFAMTPAEFRASVNGGK